MEARASFTDTNDAPLLTDEELAQQLAPLSTNGMVAFFQKMWRQWLTVWYGFSDRHPKLAKGLHQFFFFFVFSQGVTIIQYLGFTFLPAVFGIRLAGMEFMWPKMPMYQIGGVQQYWSIVGYDIVRNKAGEVVLGGGLGFFLAAEASMLVAQLINFPLQRNIAFRSHGNPWWQAMWYFVGWILVSLFVNAINSLWLPIGAAYLAPAVYNILYTVSMGGISMVIFFFIFLIIFPDYSVLEKRQSKRLQVRLTGGADAAIIAKEKAALETIAAKARLANAEKMQAKAISQANVKVSEYFAAVKVCEKMRRKNEAVVGQDRERIEARRHVASEAVHAKERAAVAYREALMKTVAK